jgi:hypothetical protein
VAVMNYYGIFTDNRADDKAEKDCHMLSYA